MTTLKQAQEDAEDGGDFPSYLGNYQKEFYDIKTVNGDTYVMCWPNAGFFFPYDGSEKVDCLQVVSYRRSPIHPLDIEA